MTTPPKASMKLGLLLRRAHVRVAAGVNTALEPLDLLARHFGVLMLVGRDGASTQRELIQQTGSDKAGMARTVELLTVRGYLDQRPSATDRRVVELRLTPAGREAFVRGRALVDAEMATLFAELEDDEIATLEALLTRFVLGE